MSTLDYHNFIAKCDKETLLRHGVSSREDRIDRIFLRGEEDDEAGSQTNSWAGLDKEVHIQEEDEWVVTGRKGPKKRRMS
jgi:hypothetical protein